MPELPEYYRQQRISTGGGGAGGGYIPETALQEAGAVLTQAGLAGIDQFFKAQETDQINTFQAETLAAISEYEQTLDPNGDVEGWESGLNGILKERSIALSKLSNSRARTNNEDWLEINIPMWRSKVAGQSRVAQMDQFESRDQLAREAATQRLIESSPQDYEENKALLYDQIMRSSGKYIDDQDFLNRTTEEGENLFTATMKKADIGRKRFIAETEAGILGQRIDDQTALIDSLPHQDRLAAVRNLKRAEWKKSDIDEITDMVERQMEAETEAVKLNIIQLLTKKDEEGNSDPDFSGAKDLANENLSQFGTKWHDAALIDIQTTAKILNNTGVNVYATTQNWTKYNQLKKDILAKRITKSSDIWKETGHEGIGDIEAGRLVKMLSGGGTSKDYRDTDAAIFYKEKFDQTLIGRSKQELADFAEETGYRWLQQWQDDNPDATLRQAEEEAWRISRRVSEAAFAGEITTNIEDLPEAGFGAPGTEAITGGEVIGVYNDKRQLVLNRNGLERLKRITGGDKVRAREIMKERRYVLEAR